MSEDSPVYSFGDCELDVRVQELRRGGELVHLEPQTLEVLAYLLAHRDRVVTKDELLDAIWRHRFVAPATLSTRIKQARQAVGDDGESQRVIFASIFLPWPGPPRRCWPKARSLELRAAMSLYRLESESGVDGDRAEAHHVLAAAYRGFTEGLETPDLREAAVLLATHPSEQP